MAKVILNNASSPIKYVWLISVDSLRSDYITNMGADEIPHIALIKERGAYFKNMIVQAPFTIPSHVSMLCGVYPFKTGVRDMHHQFPENLTTIFAILKQKDYRTLFSSQVNLFSNRGLDHIDTMVPFRNKSLAKAIGTHNEKPLFGFLHYWGVHTPYETRLPGPNLLHILLNVLKPLDCFTQYNILRRILQPFWLLRVKRIRTMMKNKDKRIPTAIIEGYKKAIIKFDKYLGQFLGVLHKSEIAETSLIIVTGDHGDSFNEHNEIDRAIGMRYEHGQFLYDNIIKVPFIIYWPKYDFNKVFDTQVQQVDIVPTIIEALNIEYKADWDGKSLWGQCFNGEVLAESNFAYSEIFRESLNLELSCIRSNCSKLIYNYKKNIYELYDLTNDAEEKNNLWPGDNFRDKDILMAKLKSFYQNTVEPNYTQQEQEQLKKTLQNLGYID